MSIEFRLPDLGEGIHEAEILKVLVSEGDAVTEDQPLFEVETDKAVVEIPSPGTGTVESLHVQEGQTVTVGAVMIVIKAGAEPGTKRSSMENGQAPVEREAVASTKARAQVGRSEADTGNGRQLVEPGVGRPVPASPATRRLARELGVNLVQVNGSGPAGRVLKEDIRAFVEGIAGRSLALSPLASQSPVRTKSLEPAVREPLSVQPVELPDFERYGTIERVPLKSVRRKIALNMTQSWSHIPHVTHCDEADVTYLEECRKKHEREIQERGGRLTLTVFALKAVVSGLQRFPEFNCSLDEATGEIIYKHYYNIGVAVATDRGLIVPVIKNVDQKSLMELSFELGDIAKRTREGKIELDRLQGGTFTITNIGAIGGTGMVPMINFPEAAILGMGRASLKPVVREGGIQARLILPLALSFDHRVADGAEAAYFVTHVARYMEDPLNLLLEA